MVEGGTIRYPIADRWSYLWLLLGGVLGLFTFGQWTVPLAPWLSIMFILRFMHTQTPLRGYIVFSMVRMVLTAVIFSRLVPASLFPDHVRYAVIVLGSLSGNLPYLADRLIAPRLNGYAATLVFPVAFTAWEFVTLTNNPMGTFGSLAYSQYGNLPLMQLVSLTGLLGLTFMITWFGSTVNWAWARSFDPRAVQRSVAVYGVVFVAVLLFGGARLAFHAPRAGTMQVASFSVSSRPGEGVNFRSIHTDREAFREKTRVLHDRYFDETRRRAAAGARLVLWPEAAGICAPEDETALIERGRELATERRIYLAMPLFTQMPERDRSPENKLIVIDPQGDIVLEHRKYGGNQFEGSVLGSGVLEVFETPNAIIGGVICWDMDFPRVMRQAGRNGTDILLAPANDWEGVSTTHAHMAVFRAIENGVSLVRQAKNGLSIATDPYGRTLARMDHFTTSDRLMTVQVPVSGVTTVYPIIGDLVGWLCIAGFVLLAARAIVRGKHHANASTA